MKPNHQMSLFYSLGLLSEPKWGHLKDLHAAIKLCEPALVAADSPQYMKLGPKQEVCFKSQLLSNAEFIAKIFFDKCLLLDKI